MKIVNAKAELMAILSCLQGPAKVKTELLGTLSSDHFGSESMSNAYGVISSMMISSVLDLPSMETFLQHPDLTQETAGILKSPTVSPVQKVDDAKRLFEILEQHRVVRRFYRFSQASLENLKSAKSIEVDALISDMEMCLFDMRSDANEAPLYHVGKGTSDEEADKIIYEIFSPEAPRLLPSCFNNFDSKTGGFGATDLFIPASHRKGGKSVVTLNVGINMYMLNCQDTIYVPLEMNKQETAERLLSNLSGVEHSKIRTKSYDAMEVKAMRDAWTSFKTHGVKHNIRFTIWPASHISIPQLRLTLKPFNYKVIIIDYINLLDHPNEAKLQDWQKLNELARELKLLTKDLEALIIAPTQMNEDGTLRYARGLAEHANTVWTWRYGEEEQSSHVIEIDQPAVRGWAPFKFALSEDFGRMSVWDYEGQLPSELKESQDKKKTKLPSMKGLK